FLLMGIMAVSMAFTSCKDDEEDSKPQPEQTSFSYNLEGETSWEPKSLLVGPDGNYILALAAKDLTEQEILDFFKVGLDGTNIPSNVFMVGMPNTVGSIDVTGNILDEQNTGYGCIFITGTTQFMGMSIPTGWLSTAMSANVTKADLTAMKFSATISATMEDFVSYVTEGMMGSAETKIFTASFENVPLVDLMIEK
ncbi:MAG: hypothetical protein IKJ67_00495, partial [Bacteroidales bacterium]|nr:hypothetical protein [Bacteroidales bacterium]